MIKSKSSHHKTENRFKFQTFSERIAHINIDVIRRVGRTENTPRDADSFFAEGLLKWSELNCTQDYVSFHREVVGCTNSFAQLVHHEQRVVDTLKRYLKNSISLAYPPLLDLIVQLARDLQTDFYPHFRDFFDIIMSLLNTQDTEVLEGAFQTIVYLFKFLWRYLLRDIKEVFGFYSPLLSEHQREHIRNFAAESFGFLMRKVRDPNDLFDFMLASVQDQPDQVAGVGRLLFEMNKGVAKQFHSCTEKVLPILLGKLGPLQSTEDGAYTPLPWQLVLDTLSDMFFSMAKFTSRAYSPVVWTALQNSVVKLHQCITSEETQDLELLSEYNTQLARVLHLVTQWVKWSNGGLIADPPQLAKVILSLYSSSLLAPDCGDELLGLTVALLTAQKVILSQVITNQLVNTMYSSKYAVPQLLKASKETFKMKDFEKDVLPSLLQYCHSNMASRANREAILFTLTDLVRTKQSPISECDLLQDYKPYMLDFRMAVQRGKNRQSTGKKKKRVSFAEYIQSRLDVTEDSLADDGDDNSIIPSLWAALLCLPSVRPVDVDLCSVKLRKLISAIWCRVTQSESDIDIILYLLCQAVVCLLFISSTNETSELLEPDFIIKLLLSHPSSHDALQTANVYFSQCSQQGLMSESPPTILEQIFPVLQPNLSSPYHKVRLLTLQIMNRFPVDLPVVQDLPAQQVSVIQLCLNAEQTPTTVEHYREKLKCLQRLEYSAVRHNIPIGGYEEVPLKYLIGMLYVNFKYLWQPVTDLIKSYAYGMKKTAFWEIFTLHLEKVATKTEHDMQSAEATIDGSRRTKAYPVANEESPPAQNVAELFFACREEDAKSLDRPDAWNYRVLMWKTMGAFADRAESRSRQLVPLLFRFMENEYYPADVNNAPTQDLRKRGNRTDQSEPDNNDDDEEEDDVTQGEEPDKTDRKRRIGRVNRCLVAKFELFSKFHDPKSMYLEPKLRELYFTLLSSKNGLIQKSVLACIMTYKHKYLTPYRENLDALMDEKLFREALVQFSIDETSGVVHEDHRKGLLPVLFRILYGKMLSKTGPGTQGKGGGSVRRNIILRFLAGSQSETEMDVFMELVMKPCQHLIKESCVEMMKDMASNLDPAAVVPLKKQHSMLDTFKVIFEKLGNLIDNYRPTMFHLIICLVASYTKILDDRNQIQPFSVNQLKNLRHVGMQILAGFFEQFDAYPFSANEMDCLFDATVWPHIENLPNESIASPTPLLKLFAIWSKNPRYHRLLAKHHPEKKHVTALPYVVALLSSTNVSQSVVATVMDIVEHLLLEGDFEASEDVPELDVTNVRTVTIDNQDKFEVPPTLGTKLLFPHVPEILEFLSSSVKLKAKALQQKGTKEQLPMRELNILSKISLYIQDPTQCNVLITLLLPYLQKTTEKHQVIEGDILQTIRNVMKLTDDPCCFLGPISRLLYRLTLRPSRAAICNIFAAMASTDPSLKGIADTVFMMNAWDRKRLEEPDYAKRLDAFKLTKERLAAMTTIDVQFLTPVIYNSFYSIMKEDDMSLRDNASHFLMAVVDKVAQESSDEESFNAIILHKFVPSIREGFRLKSESARQELIGLLDRIVQHFPNHPQFAGLNSLRDEKDPEVDFFENMRHIQNHRRMRAFKRLARFCAEDRIPAATLNYFLLPMATAVAFDQSPTKDLNLIAEAVHCIGAIATRLPWRWYSNILKQYLRLLTKNIDMQKRAVRLVVAVLDAFHYDLSLAEEIQAIIVKPQATPQAQQSVEKITPKPTEKKETKVEEEEEEGEEEEDGSSDEEEAEDTSEDVDKKKSVAMATRIHGIIVSSILPQLHGTITKKVRSEESHKKARGNMAEDDEVLRVPIALAMVKLLQALPKKTMHQNLPSVLLKVCQMQKSRSKDVRDISRDTLTKILDSLGISYFPYILKELRHALTRGYQMHVLSYTVHSLLNSNLAKLHPGELDKCLPSLLSVFNDDLFGSVADEKEVQGIVSKVFEAKFSKGYDCYEIVGKFIGQESLTQLILPLKEILDSSHSHKIVKRVQDVLRRLTFGLLENPGIPVEVMLVFIHGLVSESLPLITNTQKVKAKLAAIPPPDPRLAKPSVYILPRAPKRGGIAPQTSIKTNAHVLMEFGLQLLHMNLKRSKLDPTNKKHLAMLDPFVDVLMTCLSSKYIKVMTVGLRCLTWFLRYPLPSVDRQAPELTKMLFRILKNYATTGAVRAGSGSFDLVVSCFKAMTVMVRDVKQHSIDEDQLKVLLTYAEEDIHDHSRQATAFGLLKAILSRKLVVPEIHDVLKKVRQLSVVSEAPNVRLQCRQVMLGFLLDYPLGKKLKTHLEFYVNQVAFPMETGRESSLEMLATIFSSFPQKILCHHAGLFYIPMAARLMNEDSTKCRKLTSLAIKSLLQKVNISKRDELFDITLAWLDDDEKVSHQCLAAQLCGTFVESEGADTQRRLDTLLPRICERIKPIHFEQDMDSDNETEDATAAAREKEERQSDHLLFHLLSSLAKIMQHCAIIRSKEYRVTLNVIWESVQFHLLHPHSWVRLTSAQLFGSLFAAWKPEELIALTTKDSSKLPGAGGTLKKKTKGSKTAESEAVVDDDNEQNEVVLDYLVCRMHEKISGLASKFCNQLQSSYCDKELGDQVVRNLVFLAKILIQIQPEHPKDAQSIDDRTSSNTPTSDHNVTDNVTDKNDDVTNRTKDLAADTERRKVDLLWLMKRMCIIASRESSKSSGPTLKRVCIVKWLAAVAVELGADNVGPYLPIIMRPLNREANDKMTQADTELRTLAQEVLELLKKMVGLEEFSKAYTGLQRQAAEVKYSRKRKKALEAVVDPEQAAKRKIKKQLAKKESKKRKIQAMRPTYQINKKAKFNKAK